MFIGPFEHHSNEVSWRETIADVVTIHEDADGRVSLDHLREELERHADRPLKIGSFSAASNVTGIVTDTEGVADLLHEHGALSFWDFAACAPYVDIEMYGPGSSRKDAIFISPHKFIGGPGTPGVLVVRRELMTNRVPVVPGGGTVMYVNPTEHRYLDDKAHREEGGTPAIVESIRAGLVFQLKQAVGVETIQAHEEEMLRRAVEAWVAEPTIQILGNLGLAAALDRLLRGEGARRVLPPPQLRRRAAQRPLRHPDPRRLLLRRPLRPPAARHRPRPQPPVRGPDRHRLRGHQARLGAGELQLLRRRGGLHLRRGGRTTRGARGLAAARRLPLRPA